MKIANILKWPSRRHLRQLLKGNAKYIFAALSAVIVVASFAIKDDYRDHVKSLADTIERAEDIFILSAQTQHISNLIKKDFRKVDLLQPADKPQSAGWILLDKDGRWASTADEEVRDAKLALDIIERLARKIPGDQRRLNEISRIRLEIGEFDADWKQVRSMEPPPPVDLHGNMPKAYASLKELSYFEKATNIDIKCSTIVHDTEKLGEETLSASKTAHEAQEHWYVWVDGISYLLTILAAALTVLGVIWGIETGKNE